MTQSAKLRIPTNDASISTTSRDRIARSTISQNVALDHVLQTKRHVFLQKFHIQNSERVELYLAWYPKLIDVIENGLGHIDSIFNNHTLELKYVTDPEIQELDTLFLYIHIDTNVDTAMEQLDQLDDTWYLELPYDVRKLFEVNIKFK